MILDALKQRLRATLRRPAPTSAEIALARRLTEVLRDDGSWPDLGNATPGVAHLQRVERLARARASASADYDASFTRALDFWLATDRPAPDPWSHQIGVPKAVGVSALLCDDLLSPGARGKVAEILARPRWSRWHLGEWKEWSAAHLAAVAFNILLRGCLEGVPAWCQEAFERVYSAVSIVPAGEDGIQPDLSFQQENATSLADRCGLTFAEVSACFLILGHGTAWQAPAKCLSLFASFLLDGQQWMIRRKNFDAWFLDGDDAAGAGDLAGLATAVEDLAALGVTPRRAEMAAFARRLRTAQEPALSGHRHFWRAGLVVHQRPAFYTSVRLRAEAGRQTTDGLTCILRQGDEYLGGGALWDHRRLPGTTSVQTANLLVEDAERPGRPGPAGGVTDGEYGVAMVELSRDVAGRKAWFHFDGSLVCLGSSIRCANPVAPVFTSINQCWARGDAVAYGKGGETHVLSSGKSYDLSAAYRLEHDGIAYHFPEPLAVRARVAPQGPVREDGVPPPEVFSLWIDHGTQPRHDSYAYTVLPAAEPEHHRANEHEVSQIKILANTSAHQAVWHQELRLVGIVFWEPGIISLPVGGRVAVNRPCVLLGQYRQAGDTRLSVANPGREPATIHVEYANKCLCFNLPAGPRGGQSVTRVL